MATVPVRQTYKRGQVEWALWRILTTGVWGARRHRISPVFLTRIKRLLEIDRSGTLFDVRGLAAPPVQFAFTESAAEGTGNDASFTAFDAFCLAVALDLLDAGFKQKEIVFRMRFLRPLLEDQFPRILANPPEPSEESGHAEARASARKAKDNHVFLLLQQIELVERFRGSRGPRPKNAVPALLDPILCKGSDELRTAVAANMPRKFRTSMVLEVAELAVDVTRYLAEAPEMRRGRG
jgi:hypothetical protein